MSKLKHFLVGAALVALPFGVRALPVHAQGTTIEPGNIQGNLSDVQGNTALGNTPIEQTIGQLINVLLGLLGIIFLILVIYAGFLWMTAGGDEGQVSKAKSIIITAVIGLVILLSAYAISEFVINQLVSATASGEV